MSIHIDVDANGLARIPFNEIRKQLLSDEKAFTPRELHKLPYHQLTLASIANAGRAACGMDLAIAEKRRRRDRFLNLSPDELADAKRYLLIEGMYDDVVREIETQKAPTWASCTERTRLYLKLNCLHDHVDHPQVRLREALGLINSSLVAGSLTTDLANRYSREVSHLSAFHPHAISDEELRDKVGSLAEELLPLLRDEEWFICEGGLIRDYSCTSDCYRTL